MSSDSSAVEDVVDQVEPDEVEQVDETVAGDEPTDQADATRGRR